MGKAFATIAETGTGRRHRYEFDVDNQTELHEMINDVNSWITRTAEAAEGVSPFLNFLGLSHEHSGSEFALWFRLDFDGFVHVSVDDVPADPDNGTVITSLPRTFVNTTDDFSAQRSADQFIADRGWSVGPTDTNNCRGVMFYAHGAIAKWKNLNDAERRQCDAYLIGSGRDGILELTMSLPETKLKARRKKIGG
jgi:hypothetical protein